MMTTAGVIGPGRVGTAMAIALAHAGYTVTGLWKPTGSIIDVPGLAKLPSRATLAELLIESELVILSVPDDRLAAVVDGLCAQPVDWRHRRVLHMSGRHGCSILEPLARRGALTAATHPAMAFAADAQRAAESIPGCCFAVTAASESARSEARAVVKCLGAVPFDVQEQNRIMYHAALAHASNHLVTLVMQATQLLSSIDVERPGEVLRPLLTAALDNALRLGVAGATGPVVRGDVGTIADHLATLVARAPDIAPAYRALSASSVALALDAGRLEPAQAQTLLRLVTGSNIDA